MDTDGTLSRSLPPSLSLSIAAPLSVVMDKAGSLSLSCSLSPSLSVIMDTDGARSLSLSIYLSISLPLTLSPPLSLSSSLLLWTLTALRHSESAQPALNHCIYTYILYVFMYI